MLVSVTEADIKVGSHNPYRCPFALAIVRACPPLKDNCKVYNDSVHIEVFGYAGVIETPEEMRKWINHYDDTPDLATVSAQPIEVDLPLEKFCQEVTHVN